MRYPHGRCESCGERLYERTNGVIQCLNCETDDPGEGKDGDGSGGGDGDEDGNGGRAVPVPM